MTQNYTETKSRIELSIRCCSSASTADGHIFSDLSVILLSWLSTAQSSLQIPYKDQSRVANNLGPRSGKGRGKTCPGNFLCRPRQRLYSQPGKRSDSGQGGS